MLVATWINAIASVGLLIGAIITAIFAIRAYASQTLQLKDHFESEKASRTIWQWEYASTIVAWAEDPAAPHDGQVQLSGWVENTGMRPVRDLSVRWYLAGSAITEEEKLFACFMPGAKKDFSSYVAAEHLAAFHDRRLDAVVQFRTVGDDWWRTGTDGGLISNKYPINTDSEWAGGLDSWPPTRTRNQSPERGRDDGHGTSQEVGTALRSVR